MYDIIVIGGGPAGFSAALTSVKRNKSVCMIYPTNNDSWLVRIDEIDNYPGLFRVSGKEMLNTFIKQAQDMDIKIINGVASQIMNGGDKFYLNVDNEFIEGKNIIIATGMKQVDLIDGENTFLGKGVSYCATCDGMFYKNKEIAIIDEKNDLEEIKLLASLCSKVYLFSSFIYDSLPSNVVLLKEKVIKVDGDNKLNKVVTKDKEYPIEGLFIFRNTASLTTLLPDLKLDGKFIAVDKKMATNIKNVYACGDCTGQPFQIAKAVGEGNIAAISASTEV
jgi:thioredoxin reductase (NADPH)